MYRFFFDFFSRFDNGASGIVFFWSFHRMYFVISSNTFGISNFFFFNNISRNFPSVIEVIIYDKRSSVLKSGEWHSFSNSTSFSQRFSGVSVSVCFAQKNDLVSYICFFSVDNICCIV